MNLTLNDFDYSLDPKFIATKPAYPRDAAKLMVLNRESRTIEHRQFGDLKNLLKPQDVLVLNQTRVFPARLTGEKITGGKVEILLLKELEQRKGWLALVKPGMKAKQIIMFAEGINATVVKVETTGEILVKFGLTPAEMIEYLNKYGETPLPPYIKSADSEQHIRQEYQTVYAKDFGSAAAPTAGMHFTNGLLTELSQGGVEIVYITLHVGLGTFQRLRKPMVAANHLHEELFYISPSAYKTIKRAKSRGKRVVAVGTTTVRALESARKSGWQQTTAFYYPPYQFKLIDGLITNFHLPQSSLLMMVSAFCSFPNTTITFDKFLTSFLGKAYQEAIKQKYRFFSFGDAMLIT